MVANRARTQLSCAVDQRRRGAAVPGDLGCRGRRRRCGSGRTTLAACALALATMDALARRSRAPLPPCHRGRAADVAPRFFRPPGGGNRRPGENDPFDQLIDRQAAPTAKGEQAVGLETVIVQVQQRYPGLYYAPQRWQTRDGCVPYHILLAYWATMWSGLALERVNLGRALHAALDTNPQRREADHREAFGGH